MKLRMFAAISLAILMHSAATLAQEVDGDDDLFPPRSYHFDLISRDYDPGDPKAHLRPALDRCIERAQAVSSIIYACFADEIAFQDKRLNRAYSKLMKGLGDSDRQALRREERQWLKEMDLLCGWGFNEGSRGRMTSDNCDVVHRGLRATELERRLDGPKAK
jgi:uncharacterized protein YecT (DUF1311 family)